MIRLLIASLAVMCTSGAVAAPAWTAPQQTDLYRKLFEKVWSTINENYYDPAFHGVNWSAVGERYRKRLPEVRTESDFQRLTHAMLAELRSSHLDLLPPSNSGAGGSSIAVRLRIIGGTPVVMSVAPLSDARAKGLRLGDSVLGDLSGPLGSQAQITVQHCDGRTELLSLRRENAFWPPKHPTFQWSSITTGQGMKIGYLRIDGFDDDGAELADRAMSELADAQALVIDLRENSGGTASALRLASYFTEGAQPGLAILSRDWLTRLGHPVRPIDVMAAPRLDRAYTSAKVFGGLEAGKGGAMLWTEDMGAKRWMKPVIVLIGPKTGSAAEGFAWIMKLKTKAKIVGQESAGALLNSEVFDLGSGWSLRLPVGGIWAPDGGDYGDKSVPPDIKVSWSRAELCADRDPDLEKARALLLASP